MSNKILKINFSGASSTGKSTLCQYCANLYGEPYAPERMRDVMIKRGIGIAQITNDVFIEAADLQKNDIENLEKKAQKYLFIDSGPLIFYLGNRYSFGREFPELKERALEFYKMQDVVFLCDPHIAFDSSIMRGDVGTKDFLHEETIKFLDNHNIKYNLVFGSVAERAEQVKICLRNLEKQNAVIFANFYNCHKLNSM